MGVRGLTALIRRHAPQAIQDITAGLSHFRGQTIIVDGDLFTQRFHHGSNSSHPFRALLGWRAHLEAVRSCGIKPIVIFDGPSRPPEKARELEKRKAARDLVKWRHEREREREERLKELRGLVRRQQVLRRDQTGGAEPVEAMERWRGAVGVLEKVFPRTGYVDGHATWGFNQERYQQSDDALGTGSLDGSAITHPDLEDRCAGQPEDAVAARIHDLQAGLQTPAHPTLRPSKSQLLLASAEALAFQVAASPVAAPAFSSQDLSSLSNLEAYSSTLAERYCKASSPVTSQLLAACQSLVDLMGVPCFATPAAAEAEAWASYLVLSGRADAVASEDTDVLVYGARLVRKFGTREGESAMMDCQGKEVRDVLGLDERQWVDLALLCGTDFAGTLPGVASNRGYKLIKAHGSIEGIIANEPKYQPVDAKQYLTSVAAAREVFLHPLVAEAPAPDLWEGKAENVQEVDRLLHSVGLSAGPAPEEETGEQRGRGPSGTLWDDDPRRAVEETRRLTRRAVA